MSIVHHPSIADFDQLLKNTAVLLVDFEASWCSPCLLLAPVIEKFAVRYDGRVTVARVDVDVERALAEKYQVVSIPTVLIFKNGELLDTEIGAAPDKTYDELLKSVLKEN